MALSPVYCRASAVAQPSPVWVGIAHRNPLAGIRPSGCGRGRLRERLHSPTVDVGDRGQGKRRRRRNHDPLTLWVDLAAASGRTVLAPNHGRGTAPNSLPQASPLAVHPSAITREESTRRVHNVDDPDETTSPLRAHRFQNARHSSTLTATSHDGPSGSRRTASSSAATPAGQPPTDPGMRSQIRCPHPPRLLFTLHSSLSQRRQARDCGIRVAHAAALPTCGSALVIVAAGHPPGHPPPLCYSLVRAREPVQRLAPPHLLCRWLAGSTAWSFWSGRVKMKTLGRSYHWLMQPKSFLDRTAAAPKSQPHRYPRLYCDT